MLASAARHTFPAEYFVLDVWKTGPTIGYLSGRAIPGTVTDRSGIRYCYRGLAPRRPDGSLDTDALRGGEWIVLPGFIYEREAPWP